MSDVRITKKDWHTISLALSYARDEREGFLGAIIGSEDEGSPVVKRTRDLCARFEKLHQKLFGEPTAYQIDRTSDQNARSISIFDLHKQTSSGTSEDNAD